MAVNEVQCDLSTTTGLPFGLATSLHSYIMMLPRLAAWFGVIVLLASQVFPQEPFASACGEDARIDAAKKKTIDAVAMSFVEAVLGPSTLRCIRLLVESCSSRDDISAVRRSRRGYSALRADNVTPQHTYFIELKGKSPGRVVCATDLSKPDGWESLEAESVPEQAHVLLSADTVNNKLAIAVWLVPERNGWKVQSFRANVSTLADKDSKQLWELARAATSPETQLQRCTAIRGCRTNRKSWT